MPYLHIQTGIVPTPDQYYNLHRESVRLLTDLLGKRSEVSAVCISTLPAPGWSVGGEALDARTCTPVYAEVKITAGTNSTEDKARFIAALHSLFEASLGNLPEASYIVIQELAATDWGYHGLTQAARKAASAPL